MSEISSISRMGPSERDVLLHLVLKFDTFSVRALSGDSEMTSWTLLTRFRGAFVSFVVFSETSAFLVRGFLAANFSGKDPSSFLGLPLTFLILGVGLAEISCTLLRKSPWLISEDLSNDGQAPVSRWVTSLCLSSQHLCNTSIIFSRFLIGLKPYAAN